MGDTNLTLYPRTEVSNKKHYNSMGYMECPAAKKTSAMPTRKYLEQDSHAANCSTGGETTYIMAFIKRPSDSYQSYCTLWETGRIYAHYHHTC